MGRHPASVRRRLLSTISKKNISEASGPILIKFNVNHHWVRGVIGAACIKIVVSMHMATESSHRLTMGKTKKIFSETRRPKASIFCM